VSVSVVVGGGSTGCSSRFSFGVMVWTNVFFVDAASIRGRSRRGPMRPRQATIFGNCHNQLRDVLQSILGLQTGMYPWEQRIMEFVGR